MNGPDEKSAFRSCIAHLAAFHWAYAKEHNKPIIRKEQHRVYWQWNKTSTDRRAPVAAFNSSPRIKYGEDVQDSLIVSNII
jgi:hypothetical protein